MTIEFNNINPNRADSTTRRDAPKTQGTETSSGSNSEPASAGESSKVSVSLSSAAQGLKQTEEEIRSLPDVDIDRVNAIKEKLDSGEYSINPEELAQKMLDLE